MFILGREVSLFVLIFIYQANGFTYPPKYFFSSPPRFHRDNTQQPTQITITRASTIQRRMAKPKKIINNPEESVDEFIQGLLLQYPNRLAKLANHHVVLGANLAPSQVHLLSGGGSGHEPSHAGWIGHGMLGGAICGGIFASPSVSSILAAIRAAKSDKGVLLVVKNVSFPKKAGMQVCLS